ncbi:MAG: hypothetical protein AAF682_13625, partial [Planctomycetota bacterium]
PARPAPAAAPAAAAPAAAAPKPAASKPAAPAPAPEPRSEPEPDPSEVHAEPAPAPKPARKPKSAARTPGQIWGAVTEALDRTHGALATLLRDRGRPHLEGDAFEIALPALSQADRDMISDRRNRAAIRRQLAEAAGRPLELTIREEGSADGGAAPPPKRKTADPGDDFTKQVADLFGGVIEDLS